MKRKPNPKHIILTPKWWNPLFWFGVILSLPFGLILGAYEGAADWYKEWRSFFKEVDIS